MAAPRRCCSLRRLACGREIRARAMSAQVTLPQCADPIIGADGCGGRTQAGQSGDRCLQIPRVAEMSAEAATSHRRRGRSGRRNTVAGIARPTMSALLSRQISTNGGEHDHRQHESQHDIEHDPGAEGRERSAAGWSEFAEAGGQADAERKQKMKAQVRRSFIGPPASAPPAC